MISRSILIVSVGMNNYMHRKYARGIVVIVFWNGYAYTSLNLGWGYFYSSYR